MSEAEKILEMIEQVSPDDTAKLDEIDARVWAYLHLHDDFKIYFHKERGAITYRHNSWPKDAHYSVLRHGFSNPKVTTSRDALKAIRPSGYFFLRRSPPDDGWPYIETSLVKILKDGDEELRFSNMIGTLATEELAELHAIIQAIKYERTKP